MSTTAAAAAFESSVKPDELAHIGKTRTNAKLDAIGDNLPLAGLALSGGGIRSATFNLGILQSLAQAGKLRRFDYLSTVSGGGYIGGWLTAWIHRKGLDAVEQALADSVNGIAPEPPEVRWLRAHSNYLTPRKGVLSLDTLWGISTYLRNLVTNQMLLFALIVLVLLGGAAGAQVLLWLSADWAPWMWCAGAVLILAAGPFTGFELASLRGQRPQKGAQWIVCFSRTKWGRWMIASLLVTGASLAAFALARDPDDAPLTQGAWPFLRVLVFPAFWILAAIAGPLAFEASSDVSLSSTVRLRWGQWFWWILASTLVFWGLEAAYVHGFATHPMARGWLVPLLGPTLYLAALELSVLVLIMLAGRLLRPFAHDWLSRVAAMIIRVSVLPFAVFASWIVLAPTVDLLTSRSWALSTATLGWLATTILGVLGGKSAATGPSAPRTNPWLERALVVTPYVFVLGLFTILVWATREITLWSIGRQPGGFEVKTVLSWISGVRENLRLLEAVPMSAWIAGSIGVFLLVSLLAWRIDINLFSFHAYYRNRLAQAYLGASATNRRTNAITGYSPADSPLLDELGTMAPEGKPIRPYPIINTALNLSGRPRMEWQQRKAASFVFSPIYCGYELPPPLSHNLDTTECPKLVPSTARITAHRRTDAFLGGKVDRRIGHSLAITVSGAAASPNMGYHTSTAVAALLTAFNVRLGWWMPNPRFEEPWARGGPDFSTFWMIKELTADANETDAFVYLSDGGHFENLGVYELLRRRCKLIVACDASADSSFRFEDLANLVHKARADFGIEIATEDAVSIRPQIDAAGVIGPSKVSYVVASITYPETADGLPRESGFLVYLKSSLPDRLPADIENYRWTAPGFPHQSTGDQWFDETQFEAYRKLGVLIGTAALQQLPDKVPPIGW